MRYLRNSMYKEKNVREIQHFNFQLMHTTLKNVEL